ncbi:hypothetical protein KBC75_01050 [Candidatus Shapirobacteria bacterium]|nr:hypothetical protein [Candidatus Shapirobacteria bacterium]
MTFLEFFEKELIEKPRLNGNKKILYTVNEGPNGGGKTFISQKAAELSALNFYKMADLYTTAEPPRLRLDCVPGDLDARHFLKGGFAGDDTREQLAVFMMARRKLQELIFEGDMFGSDVAENIFRSTVSTRIVVMSDRGVPSSKVYQVRSQEQNNPKLAKFNRELISRAYKTAYLKKYDLVTFIQPTSIRSSTSTDDVFEGRFAEISLYAEEIRGGGFSREDANNMIWVVNDPTGQGNDVSEPVGCTAATTLAVLNYGRLNLETTYTVPFRLGEGLTGTKLQYSNEIVSGNVFLKLKPRSSEATLEITPALPQVR